MSFKLGDHLVSLRKGYLYMHHGIYVAKDLVVHYSGLNDGFNAGPIMEDSLEAFASGKEVRAMPQGPGARDSTDILERAYSRLGEDQYNLVTNNCEHFANWCIYGLRESAQVKGAFHRTASSTLTGAARLASGGVTSVAGIVGVGATLAVVTGAQLAATMAKWRRCQPAKAPA